ncbi:MAG: NUDIX domain-containing protein [Beijerinckiaceae bacterium]|nr:NUDIX domain-containing protein [Beijerinckiaceae bacterium]
MTLGVRAVVLDREDRVLLVRHSYIAGWHLPGGGVDAGETLHAAMARELAEETAVTLTAPARLHGIFFSTRFSRRDHVAVYIVRDFDASRPRKPDWEILETGFFAAANLPEGVTKATKSRLMEILDGAPVSEHWL